MIDDAHYAALSAVDIAAGVAARRFTARAVIDAALARIERTEPTINAFIHLDAEGARAAADALDRRLEQDIEAGPLAGVPVSVKDLVHVAGMPTSGGSLMFAGTMAPGDAAPVARLREAGAIIVGKTTTPEFGHKPITSSPLFGETLNPWNRRFTAGGSSGGAAASLAARQVPLAVGTDGGGSIRIPASVCGVFGLKATLGRIAHVHAADLFGNNSFIGPMARSIDDLRLMYEVMTGADPRDPWSRRPADGAADRCADRSSEPLRIGFAARVGNPALEPEVAAGFDAALAALATLGCELVPIELDLACREPDFRVHLQVMLAARFAATMKRDASRFDPTFVRTVELGLQHSGIDLARAVGARSELYREIETVFAKCDYLVTPTVSAASVLADTDPHAELTIAGQACGPIRAGWYPYTFPFNLTGHPAMSLPVGWTSESLPIGLQIVGPWDGDLGVMELARSIDSALAVPPRCWSI